MRKFECYCGENRHVVTGKKPKQAANKMYSIIHAAMTNELNNENTDQLNRFKFCVKEIGNKEKEYYYIGERIALDNPEIISVKTNDGYKEIKYLYRNEIKKYDPNAPEEQVEKQLEKSEDLEQVKESEDLEQNDDQKCILNQYIDFNEIMNNVDESIGGGDNEPYWLMGKGDTKHLIDYEIKKYAKKNDNIKQINQMILDARNYQCEVYNTEIKIDHNLNAKIQKYIAHKSVCGKYIVFYVLIKSKENNNEIEILGLVNADTQKYVFLGCSGSHPFIATCDFTFGNSDGSGPTIKHDLLRDQSSDRILNLIDKYFNEFVSDDYH